MKNILQVFVSIALGASLHAAILTVDNNPGAVAQYNNFSSAYEAAADGDTILLAGSPVAYGVHTIYKRIDIIGPGYLFNENRISGLVRNGVLIVLKFEKGNPSLGQGDPSGSSVKGVQSQSGGTGGVVVEIGQNIGLIRIDKCTGKMVSSSPVAVNGIYGGVELNNGSSNSILSNSILVRLRMNSANSSATNCVIMGNIAPGLGTTADVNSIATTTISNSIFTHTASITPDAFAAAIQGSVTNCLAISGAYLPAGNGNINGPQAIGNVFMDVVSDDLIFLGLLKSESKWLLKPDSPAIGAGNNGVDIGAFGGPTPYRLSGVPGVPRLTRLDVPPTATSTSGLRFEVDAQAFGN